MAVKYALSSAKKTTLLSQLPLVVAKRYMAHGNKKSYNIIHFTNSDSLNFAIWKSTSQLRTYAFLLEVSFMNKPNLKNRKRIVDDFLDTKRTFLILK